MNLLPLIGIFFFLGLCFGSFSTVLIERWHEKKGGILLWRSECPSCHHQLSALELIPLLSYVFQNGKCRNCGKNISIFYPAAELTMGLIFAIMSWIALSFEYTPVDVMWWVFISWWFITGVYIIYDIRYMEIPDQVLVPWIYWTLILLLAGTLSSEYSIFFDVTTYQNFHTFLTDHISWAVILYTFLYIQILIPGWYFLIKNRKKMEFLELILSYFLFPITILIGLFDKSKQDSWPEIPTWVGWWDLRVAIFIWLSLWSIHGIASFLIAYIIGSFVGIIILLRNHKNHKKMSSQIAFWPFLWIGWILSLLFYNNILDLLNI